MTDTKDAEYVCEECDGSGWVNCECPHCGDDHMFVCECPAWHSSQRATVATPPMPNPVGAMERAARALLDQCEAGYIKQTAGLSSVVIDGQCDFNAMARAAVLALLNEGDEKMDDAVKAAVLPALDYSNPHKDDVALNVWYAIRRKLRALAQEKQTDV